MHLFENRLKAHWTKLSVYAVIHFPLFIKTFANIERLYIFVDINVISFKFFKYNIHDACAALAYLSHKEFGTCDTICINTNVFLTPVRDIVRFDIDAIVGKASENSREMTYEY